MILLLLSLPAWKASARPAGAIKFAFISNPSFYIRHLVLEPLVVSDRGRIKPMLAESWQWLNPRILEMHLRSNVRFHDGSLFNASAVKANFDFFRKSIVETILRDYFKKTRCEIISPLTVRFVLDKADSLFLFQLSKIFQIAPAMLEKLAGRAYVIGSIPLSGDWGTGPFRITTGLVESTAWSDEIVLKAFEAYWNPVYPKVERIYLYDLFRHFGWPADEAPDYAKKAIMDSEGEIDIVSGIKLQTLTVARSKHAKIAKIGRSMLLGLINMRKTNSVWRDIRLRQALNLAVNRPLLVEMAKGNNDINAGLILPGDLGHNSQLQPHAYDPQQAKSLLKAAGYAEGLDVKILLPATYDKMSAMLGEALEQGGFRAEFIPMEINELIQKYQLPKLDRPVAEQDWDICLVKLFRMAYHPYCDVYQRYFSLKGFIRWIEPDPGLQRLIERIATTPDPAKQALLLRQCESRVCRQAYILSLWSSANAYAINNYVFLPTQLTDERFLLKEIDVTPSHWSLRP